MKDHDFYTDIKDSIEQRFAFLNNHGFTEFKVEQIAYEFHFKAKNDFVVFDISFESIVSTPIWATLNEYHLDNLELKNQNIQDYRTSLRENYDDLFEQYSKTHDSKFLHEMWQRYSINGKEINDKYLLELSDILKRHTAVLNGDFELLRHNSDIVAKDYEQKKAMDRVRNGTYTLEYRFFQH